MLRIKYLILFLLVTGYVMAQHHGDHITPLRTNPVLVQQAKEKKKSHHLDKIGPPPTNPVKTVHLPFLDDFSRPGPYPNPDLWQNNNVFVNYTYPLCPHTLGVATFDGVNGYGQPYDSACPLNGSYPADTLTSQHIQMGNYKLIGDSVYFSFYYQPGGLGPLKWGYGSNPKTNDTLVLEFFNGVQWNEVWYHLGYVPQPADTGFHFVHFVVTDSQYFINGFQFRFRNYANTSGNLDHWNIDEVFLGANRNARDTAQYDISFVYESPSLLNTYEFMPWEQLTSGDLSSKLNVYIRNNDSGKYIQSEIPSAYKYDTIPGFLTGYTGGFANELPFWSNWYVNYPVQTYPPLVFTASSLPGPVTYTFTQILYGTPDFDQWNDTLRFNQIFSNYYAYDDGTAEAGYSVIPYYNTPADMAVQFTLNHPDSLVGLYVYYDYVLDNASPSTFRLCLWNAGTGEPGTLVHEDTSIYNPRYSDSLNGFTYYPFHFATGTDSLISGTFYIGWEQTGGDSLNIGYDWNNDNEYKIFYNLHDLNGWQYSSYPGSLMIRPVFSNRFFNPVNNIADNTQAITLYPNPARDEVRISPNMLPNTMLRIYSADGRLIQENENFSGNYLSTTNLTQGFYIVELTPKDGKTSFQKLLISR